MNSRFVFWLVLVTRKLLKTVKKIEELFNDFLMIENVGYAFLIRLDLMFSMSLWKELQLLWILNSLSVKYLIILILYENDVKLLNFKRSHL